jgi:hypothetical protein
MGISAGKMKPDVGGAVRFRTTSRLFFTLLVAYGFSGGGLQLFFTGGSQL